MSLEIITIASSSKGNCTCIRNDNRVILIDMGISLCRLKIALNNIKISIDSIDAIIVTHEHNDHVSGLSRLLSKHKIPIYANRDSMNLIAVKHKLNDFKSYDVNECGFSIGDIDIQPFRTRHDSVHSLGYSFYNKNNKISIATDLGCVTSSVINNLSGSDAVLVESNYDANMLRNGSYPQYIKNRILSSVGHLSNQDCAELVLRLAGAGTRSFLLGHLSENNNTRRLAYSTTSSLLESNGYNAGRDIFIDVASANSIYSRYSTGYTMANQAII